MRDPIKRTLEHVDLVAVRKGEKVTVEVPIHLIGKGGPDTLVDQQTMTLTIEADATHAARPRRGQHRGPQARPAASTPRTSRCPPAPRWRRTPSTSSSGPRRSDLRGAARGRARRRCGRATRPSVPEDEAAAEEPPPRPRPTATLPPPRPRPQPRWPTTSGWSSAWATPDRRTPATGTTSASWWPTCSPSASAGSSRRTRAGPTPSRAGSAGQRVVLAKPKCYMNESGGPVASLRDFFKVPAERIVVVLRRARHPLRHAAAQARRRRQRPQRAQVDHQVARHRRLPAGPLRHRPPARSAGPGRLRAQGLRGGGDARSCPSTSTGPPTPSRRW